MFLYEDARNKATHFVGVPLIMLAILIPLSWPGFQAAGITVTAAMLLAAAVLAYYFVLDLPLAAAMLVVMGVLVFAAEAIAALGAAPAWSWFAALFIGGWILQLAGIKLNSAARTAPKAPSALRELRGRRARRARAPCSHSGP